MSQNYIDKDTSQFRLNYLDFTASTIAFLEWQGKDVSMYEVEKIFSEEDVQFYKDRLAYYRGIYKPK